MTPGAAPDGTSLCAAAIPPARAFFVYTNRELKKTTKATATAT